MHENLLGALADPDLVNVAIEPGSVTDAAGGSFCVAACFLRCDASHVLGISQLWRSQTPVGVSKIDMP